MASPKSKISRSRRGMRRSHSAIGAPNIGDCQNCGSHKQPHHVCPSCGYYHEKEVTHPKD